MSDAATDTVMMSDVPATPTPTPEEACDLGDERSLRCGITSGSREECIADFACTGFFRPDAIGPIVRCETGRGCDESDDACYVASELGIEESSESMTYTTDCLARRTECASAFSDDFCYAQLASTESLAAITTCVEMECASISECLDDVYARNCGD